MTIEILCAVGSLIGALVSFSALVAWKISKMTPEERAEYDRIQAQFDAEDC